MIELVGDYAIFGNICVGDLAAPREKALDVMALTCDDMPPLV